MWANLVLEIPGRGVSPDLSDSTKSSPEIRVVSRGGLDDPLLLLAVQLDRRVALSGISDMRK